MKQEAFIMAVTQDLGQSAYKQGLQALKAADRSRVKLENPRLCHGSADIDSALVNQQPQASRWDYVIAQDQRLHFVEVHPAHTSEVNQVIKKKQWLLGWLQHSELNKLKTERNFHWVASGKIAITPNSKQARAAALSGLKPLRHLAL